MRRAFLAVILFAACADDTDGDGDAADAAPPADAAPGADAATCLPPGGGPSGGVAVTSHGLVRGQLAADGETWTYLGVPYAAPPVGDLRFAPPAPLGCFTGGEHVADAFGPRCPQLAEEGGAVLGDEDCLTLNVWQPTTEQAAPFPVLVFIHGGGNVQGGSADPLYDGAALATAANAVVVTLNYRLGALGTLTHAAGGAAGNQGLADQIAALAWVQAEIAGFHGDPTKVLVFGESAGARDLCALMATPASAGLFSAALMQSGGCSFPTAAQAADFGAEWAEAAGCSAAAAADVAACLRALPLATVMATLPQSASVLAGNDYQPHVDGSFLPEQPIDALAAGRAHDVPFVVGANADETGASAPAIPSAMAYEDLVRAQFPLAGDAILAAYPAGDYPTPRRAYVALTSDLRFICPSRTIARAAAAGLSSPVRRYFFTHSPSVLGAVHGIELPYLFASFAAVPYTPTADDLALTASLQGYWSRLAASGDPNGGGAPVWPEYTTSPADSDLFLELAVPPAPGDGVRRAQCDFWDDLLP